MQKILVALGLTAALVSSARSARAGDPEPAPAQTAARTTHYVALPDATPEERAALVERVRAALPGAQVELVGDALRVQTDGDVLPQILHALGEGADAGLEGRIVREGLPKPPDAPRPAPEQRPKDKPRHAKDADTERATVKVEVGRLCEGCAECLADALRREFPDARCAPDGEEHVKVHADRATHAAVQAWLALARAKGREVRLERVPGFEVVRERELVLEGREPKEALRGRLMELGRRMLWLHDADDDDDDADHDHKHARHGAGMGGAFKGRGGLRERLEAREHKQEPKPEPKRAPMHDAARVEGPLSEARRRMEHLHQAAEHLQAAGWEGLAAQVKQELARVQKETEVKAQALHREEQERVEAKRRRAVEEKQRSEEKRREAEESVRRHIEAKKRALLELPGAEAKERKPAGDVAMEELLGLVRALRKEVEVLRREVTELKAAR